LENSPQKFVVGGGGAKPKTLFYKSWNRIPYFKCGVQAHTLLLDSNIPSRFVLGATTRYTFVVEKL